MTEEKRPTTIAGALNHVSHLKRVIGLVWVAAKGWVVAWAILLLIQGLLPAATVLLTKLLVDAVADVVGSGLTRANIMAVAGPAALIAIVLLLGQIFESLLGWIRTAQSEYVTDSLKSAIHKKAAEMDLAFYETPEKLDQLLRAASEAGSRSLSILQSTGTLVRNSITLISISIILLAYGVWLPLLLLVSTLPALWVVVRHNRRYHQWWEQTTAKRRWEQYFDIALTSPYSASEIRTLALADHLRSRHDETRRLLRSSRLRLMRQQTVAQFFAGFSALAVTAATMAWMGARALGGSATLGDLALFYQAFSQGQGLMRSLLQGVGQLYSDALFIEHLFALLEIEPKIVDMPGAITLPDKVDRSVHFRDVTFTYPGSSSPALTDFDLSLPAGKTVAVVGPNGAGKSTLIKLLCRLYEPDSGSVEIDGTDVREIALHSLRRDVTVMFQTPVQWIATAADNIVWGDIERGESRDAMVMAARAAGADEFIERLDFGYETLLSKQFKGGTELSGGQWQRIALARAFYRDAPIVVLDEPTSFMDSWEEARWLGRFHRLVENKTVLIVTHRFTTAMHADLIHVMDEGRLVESGSHDELVKKDGLYAASWKQQYAAGHAG